MQGKTYSLFGNNQSTDEYYNLIENIANIFLTFYSIEELSSVILHGKTIKNFIEQFFINYSQTAGYNIHDGFDEYTQNVNNHIEALSIIERWDKTIGLKKNQYHFYMLEAEIINRLNKERFKRCENKMAFLPHCLRDANINCKAESDGSKLVCKNCLRSCFINQASLLLKANNIKTYVWLGREEQSSFHKKLKGMDSLGVLGVACVPELINGMRRYIKIKVPVIGIPLNANRCRRWMGEYYDNSFNIERLINLIN